MDSQIVLREIASTAADLIHLNQVSGNGLHARVKRQPIALRSREFESDPVVILPAHVAKNHRFAVQILDHDVHTSIIEKIPEGRAAADLRHLNRRANLFADIAKRSIALVQEQELWLPVSGPHIESVHLWIDVPVDEEKVWPAVIIKVKKCRAPANVRNRRSRYPCREGNIGKTC